jgi:hypothetical protein
MLANEKARASILENMLIKDDATSESSGPENLFNELKEFDLS